ncbi:MAG: AlwI family type II restriction endonuclease [Gammaproteobacteria bacterium]|nr:AlwI family type II restriction endonuclease [Gammaproteobacteria bacterium]
MLWHIGNTTVRTPYRLRDALLRLQGSEFNGNLIGRDQEHAFALHLDQSGVLSAPRADAGVDASDLGRKWRSALSQLGLITPALTTRLKSGQQDSHLTRMMEGLDLPYQSPFEITSSGANLAGSESLAAQQECFLRALVAYQIPSILEPRYRETDAFSPLLHSIEVLRAVEKRYEIPAVTSDEFALFLQTSTPSGGAESIAEQIGEFRDRCEGGAQQRKATLSSLKSSVANENEVVVRTLYDYADLSARCLKATGLLLSHKRGGVCLNPSKRLMCDLLLQEPEVRLEDREYLHRLWRGAELPTDDVSTSIQVLSDLRSQLREQGVEIPDPVTDIDAQGLATQRHDLEGRLSRLREEAYASAQAQKFKEIGVWMESIRTGRSVWLDDETTLSVPRGERPAYLEWILWRAFLAIDSLVNTPWDARRFEVDQDFLPVHCAPGGGPDMQFEFDEYVVVVEVTLTSSSRQEAAEGEPVRRHVADVMQKTDKEVFGLFVAVQIDSNTAHTFRLGDWYLQDDRKMSLQIVPMMLEDFRDFFLSGESRPDEMVQLLKEMLLRCRVHANEEAPAWKATIRSIVDRYARHRNA